MEENRLKNAQFFPALESARGIAAVLVAGLHISQAPIFLNGETQRLLYEKDPDSNFFKEFLRQLHRMLSAGHADLITPGVLFFFVLSGFVLTSALHQRWQSGLSSSIEFLIGRAIRLMPPIVSTVLIFYLVFLLTGRGLVGSDQYEFLSIVRNSLLIDVSIVGVMWSLQVEALAILFILILFISHRRWGLKGPILLMLLTTGLVFIQGWRKIFDWPGGPPRILWLYAFSFGAMTYYLRDKIKLSPRANFYLGWVGVGLFFLVPLLGFSRLFRIIVTALAASAIILVLANDFSNKIKVLLENRGLRFLGKISYSFYLLHPLTLLLVWNIPEVLGYFVSMGIPRAFVSFTLWSLSIVVILPLSFLSYRYIEVPAQKFGHRLRRYFDSSRHEIR